MMEYVLLGSSLQDGLLGWITVGINTTETREVIPAVYYGSNGGVESGDSIGLGTGSA